MSDGLKRATLAALLSRGPWQVRGDTLTPEQVDALYRSILAGRPSAAACGCSLLSDRKCDRALQMLRRAGLIRYDRPGRTWVPA